MGLASHKKKANTKGVVITKSAGLIKLIDNGILRMKFQVISDMELKRYEHPMYKPLIP